MLLPKLIDPASTTAKDQSIICPLELQSSLVVSFEHLTATVEIPTCGSAEGLIHSGKAYGYTTILPLLALDRKALDSIRNSLAKLVHVTLLSDDIDKDIVDFALGAGFICYMETSKTTDDVDMTICHALLSQGHRFESLPSFLQAVHDYIVAISRCVKHQIRVKDTRSRSVVDCRLTRMRQCLGLRVWCKTSPGRHIPFVCCHSAFSISSIELFTRKSRLSSRWLQRSKTPLLA